MTGPALAAPAGAKAASPKATTKAADINKDGYDDLAVGAAGGTIKGHAKAGYVALAFGSKSGVDTKHHRALAQGQGGVPGTPEAGDGFGSSVAVADVNGDGYADVIATAPEENIGDTKNAGSVTIAFGSKSGLSNKAIAFHEPKVSNDQEFGENLAVGDFNHDGRQDVAASDGDEAGGKVWLVYGAKKLASTPTPKMTGFTPPKQGMGTFDIDAADVNGDGTTDLVTVTTLDDPADGGTLAVMPGSKSGLKTKPLGTTETLYEGVQPATVGDINGDGKADVLIDNGHDDAGNPVTYPGSTSGLDTAHQVRWSGPHSSGAPDRLADINGDGHADVVLSDPQADGQKNQAGSITIGKGTKNWLTASGAQQFTLDTKGVAGTAADGDEFGSSVAPADYNGDGLPDLAVGVPGKNNQSGAVSVLYASKNGLTAKGSILFGPSTLGYPTSKAGFGSSLGLVPPR